MLRTRFLLTAFVLCGSGVFTPSLAPAQTDQKPVEISAAGSLEWHRDDQLYKAVGDAVVIQGDNRLSADTVIARYVGKNTDIKTIEAMGNVRLTTNGAQARGDKALYTLATQNAVLTGSNLELQSGADRVTAKDSITWNGLSRKLTAKGHAQAVQGDDTITADRLDAYFKEDTSTGASSLTRMEAAGGVVITTPTETLYGDKGAYDAAAQTATMVGNVRIERDGNTLSGAKAEVDLARNISRIFAHDGVPDGVPHGDGRVRGVFYPQ